MSETPKPQEGSKEAESRILLGVGFLNWNRGERITDRYGAVGLLDNPSLVASHYLDFYQVPVSEYGKLIAEVIETRESEHVGDLARKIFPKTPKVGEVLVLGEGTLFAEEDGEGGKYVGLRPQDDRKSDWLDPHVLYITHSQKVRLFFERVEKPATQ